MVDMPPPGSRVVEVTATERLILLDLLRHMWEAADEARMTSEPGSWDATFHLERQQVVEGMQRKLR
jgi:hypothetical protein